MRPIAIDLFAGAGGMSLGFDQAGFDVVAALDADPLHCATHEYNFPATAIICRDVRNTNLGHVEAAVKTGIALHQRFDYTRDVDVVIGGPPCQGFSVGGLREVGDERNDLVIQFARMVVAIQPRYFVMENVPGLGSKKHERLLGQAINRLEKAGYTVDPPIIVDTSELGIPQARRRLVISGNRRGEKVLRLAPSPRSRVTVWEAISDLAKVCTPKRLLGKDQLELSDRDLELMSRNDSAYSRLLRRAVRPNGLGYMRSWNPRVLTNVRTSRHEAAIIRRFARTAQGEREPISRYVRLNPRGVAPVLRAGTDRLRGSFTSPRPIHPYQHRVLNVREAARLQSFPDWFNFHVTNWHGYRQLGNSVPPMLAHSLAQGVRQSLAVQPTPPEISLASGDSTLLHLDFTTASSRYIPAKAKHP